MEDDDEFGDLYTDVLRPLTAAVHSQKTGTTAPASSQGRKTDPNLSSDDEEILYGASSSKSSLPNPNSFLNLKLSSSTQDKTLPGLGSRPDPGGFDLNLEASSRTAGGDGLDFADTKVLEKGDGLNLREKGSAGPNFMDDDDGLNIVVEKLENKDDRFPERDANFASKEEIKYSTADQNENSVNLIGAGRLGADQMIPGLAGKLGNHGVSNFQDDWESDESEDDLEIVLNDNNAGLMGMERMDGVHDEDDEEGEPLVIVADNGDIGPHQQMIDEQDWGGEEGGPGADGERKEMGDATKAIGGGVTAATTALPPKVGYSNHMYHHPFHSQFKYVRPGAAPIPGTAGGIQGQTRPPVTVSVLTGRGRIDWRPTGIRGAAPVQKGFHPNYGAPGWGANAGRGYGSGLDFTLPSHKTIFEVDIDGFEEKPWKFPGIDVSDFFNFGLNEESWKDYCKQLEQFRLETTMHSKIRVYESGRAEQDYDPDLPPELAAAVGKQDIPSGNACLGKEEAHLSELARARLPVQIGRPIPVETGSGERLPSIDTRRLRLHDSDTIIEIFCHSSADDDGTAAEENNPDGEDPGMIDGNDECQTDGGEHTERIPFNVQKRDAPARRARHKDSSSHVIESESNFKFPSVPLPYLPDRDRSAKGRGHAKSHKITGSNDNGENQIIDQQNESLDSDDGKINPHLSSSHTIESEAELAVAVENEVNDEPVMDDRSLGIAAEERAAETTTTDALEDEQSMHAESKQKVSAQVEQLSQETDDGQDSKTAMSSENSKARSGSSKDNQHFIGNLVDEDEVLQDRHVTHTGSLRRQVEDEDNSRRKGRHEKDEFERHHEAVKGREESYSRRGGDPNSSMNRHILKSENADFRKENDMSEGSWRRREEDIYARRIRAEETRKTDHGGEILSRNRSIFRERERSERDESHQSRNELDKGTWRGADHDQDMGLRQRDRELKNQDEVDDYNDKRRKEGLYKNREQGEKEEIAPNHKESSSRRKRERNDGPDQWKRDDHAKRDDGLRYVRQKEGSLQKERGERHRDRDERSRPKTKHGDVLSRREKEETLPDMRTGRPAEEKSWASHSRGKDNYKGSGREYNKDGGRHVDQVKRRDRAESEILAQHRVYEDVHARGNQGSNDDKRARYERPHASDDRAVNASVTSRQQERRQKDTSRKNKEFESGKRGSLVTSQRNQDEHNGQISATVNFRGRTGRENAESDVHVNRPSLKKQGEEASSDDEQIGSRRGRSKLERWTSHKERDFGPTSPLSSKKKKNTDAHDSNGASLVQGPPEEPSKILEGQPKPSVDDKNANGVISQANTNTKVEDKHLDTVEKLKKRSERFKLPMPIEKDAPTTKKMENEPLPSIPTDNKQDTEIKLERPARKRRWTGN